MGSDALQWKHIDYDNVLQSTLPLWEATGTI